MDPDDPHQGSVLIEVAAIASAADGDGLVETRGRGVAEHVKARVAVAVDELHDSLLHAVSASGQAMIDAAKGMTPSPKTVEVTFGVSATGEGHLAIVEGSGQANFSVRLVWELASPT